MGVIKTSEDQDFLVTKSSKAQEKGKSKKKEPKAADSNQQTFERASSSKKKKKKCPYCMRGFHLEDLCMKNISFPRRLVLKDLCVQNNISLPWRVVILDDEEQNEEDEICLHASLSPSKAYVIDSGASNHMVAFRESLITFPLSGGPSSHMGDESKIPYCCSGINTL